jgi:hypothetical protein
MVPLLANLTFILANNVADMPKNPNKVAKLAAADKGGELRRAIILPTYRLNAGDHRGRSWVLSEHAGVHRTVSYNH